ncbi:hypothetical protein [Methylobacterium sp. NFXW15]|uniref:hypothetical protein n=1 Tax=Methylobacterium sp. NFXW15 TaxID=2819512 RepID=UPI003CF0CBF4
MRWAVFLLAPAAFLIARHALANDAALATPDPEIVRSATAAIGRQLGSADARVSGLRTGRGGVLCGSVDVRNRMGTYTGPRPFVFDPATGVAGRLPEGPELRHPSSMAEYQALDQARAHFVAHCTGL